MRLGMLSIGLLHCYWVTLCDSWHKNSSRMALFDALWHCVLPLDHILEVFTGVQVWSLGWQLGIGMFLCIYICYILIYIILWLYF